MGHQKGLCAHHQLQQMQEGKEACPSKVCGWICSLKVQGLPVVFVEGTVQLGACKLLVDGLVDVAMHWVMAVQVTHTLCWIVPWVLKTPSFQLPFSPAIRVRALAWSQLRWHSTVF